MRRWLPRALPALLITFGLPAAVGAQPPAPATPPVTPPVPPAVAPPPAAVPAPPAGPATVVPYGAVYVDPYHAATPYNPTIGQAIPNPAYNRPVMTLPCANPNQNFDPFAPTKPACNHRLFRKDGGCGCEGGCGQEAAHPKLDKVTHPCAGACSKGGSCTTCCNTNNFIFASSRSYFGESSREFLERPPSPDGIKMQPVKYLPPPAPAAYTPAYVIVPVR